ncbi:IS3 family transposase [Streptococcus pluranimalium]|uniref:IS3 family transposase n=1 Tax=Streptococcus pluranimalium TaxID=82348 RepID=UPI003F692D38
MIKEAYSVETKLACIEWFHSVLKSETFYLHNWRNLTKDSITDIVKNDITFYNETRIQQRLNDLSPVQYRKSFV